MIKMLKIKGKKSFFKAIEERSYTKRIAHKNTGKFLIRNFSG